MKSIAIPPNPFHVPKYIEYTLSENNTISILISENTDPIIISNLCDQFRKQMFSNANLIDPNLIVNAEPLNPYIKLEDL